MERFERYAVVLILALMVAGYGGSQSVQMPPGGIGPLVLLQPFQSGSSLPSTCSVGSVFFLTSAAAGANLFGCTGPNAWTLESSAGGGSSGWFEDAEVPAGAVDGSNASYVLLHGPSGTSLLLERNGITQKAGTDYTLSGNTITFSPIVPQAGDILQAWYRY